MKNLILVTIGLFFSLNLAANNKEVRYVSANQTMPKAIGVDKGLLTVDIENKDLMLNQKKLKLNSFQKAIIQIIAESVKKAEICQKNQNSKKIILHRSASPASGKRAGFCNENVSNLIYDNFKVLKDSIGTRQLR